MQALIYRSDHYGRYGDPSLWEAFARVSGSLGDFIGITFGIVLSTRWITGIGRGA